MRLSNFAPPRFLGAFRPGFRDETAPDRPFGRTGRHEHLAEGVGFEPTEACTSHAFEACPFGRSGILPGGRLAETASLDTSSPATATVLTGVPEFLKIRS